jgi:hypothetical protein
MSYWSYPGSYLDQPKMNALRMNKQSKAVASDMEIWSPPNGPR